MLPDPDPATYTILDHPAQDARVYKAPEDPQAPPGSVGPLLFHVRRGILPTAAWEAGRDAFLAAGKQQTTNRGAAAGARQRHIVGASAASSGSGSPGPVPAPAPIYEQAGKVRSGVVGYLDSPNNKRPCRLTAYSRANLARYESGLALVRAMDDAYRQMVPDRHSRQLAAAEAHGFHIPGTAFSTVTVNYNFQTGVHTDAGDYRDGFGTLCVVSTPGCSGGLLVFPGFRVAVRLYNGDFMSLDVHEHHANSPIRLADPATDYRLSFVAYLRERLAGCPEANRRLRALHGGEEPASGRWDTDRMLAAIFGKTDPRDLPEKRPTGTGPQGHTWWSMEDDRWRVTYKGKRYELLDKNTGHRVHNLGPALDHVTAGAPSAGGS